jgi:hypothetical protein
LAECGDPSFSPIEIDVMDLRDLSTMPHPDPTPFITAFNAWDRNDLDLPPAAVRKTSVQCVPETPGELIALLPEAHRSFMRDACGPEYESLSFGAAQTTSTYDCI